MLFRDVIGHDVLKQQLINNVNNHRLSHAQLFLGPEGSGNLALALAFAQYIQCRNKGPEDACGTCPSCLKLKKLEHPDLHFFFPVATNKEIDKKPRSQLFYKYWREMLLKTTYFRYYQWLEKIGIENKQAIINADDCNDIIRTLGLKTYESPFKIVIIWMVEKLFHAAAPKLLKVLEEPPENTIFLLVSENRDLILNTILSRTQLVKVPRLTDQEIEQGLLTQYGCGEDQARQIAFQAAGNFNEALRLLQTNNEPLEDFNQFRDWMRLCFSTDIAGILKWVDGFSKAGREKHKTLLHYGLNVFRTCLLYMYQTPSLIRLEGQEKEFVQKFSPFINEHTAPMIIQEFSLAIAHVERNANSKILFTDLSLKLAGLLKSSR
ncbi:MAG: DNA polymerase III subunit delta [Bacteroidales bacterium]